MKSFMNKLNALFDKKWFRIVLLAVIIAAELSYTIYLFANEKHGQHSDEVWSYSIANSSDDFSFESPGFVDQWQTTERIRKYMTVQPEERFHFDIAYRNNITDLNPPLYYMVLHGICSFFPNQYSPWYAFSINLASLIGTQIFLYLLCCECFKEKRYMPFVVCIFYALCGGSAATYVFLRMYAPMTTLCVANLYYQMRVLHHEGKGLWKPALGSFITCYLGFMTHSFFPVIGGIATFMVCLWFLCHKQIKRCFGYGFTMVGSLALYAITFFPGVQHVFNAGEASQTAGATYPFRSQFLSLLSYVSVFVTGFPISIFKGYTGIYVSAVLIVVVVISIPLCFLFRNEVWFKKFVSGIKDFFVSFVKERKFWKVFDYGFFLIAAVLVAYLAVGAKVINVVLMGASGPRYLFALFPLACVLISMVLYFVLSKIKYVKSVSVVVTMALVLVPAYFTLPAANAFLYNYAVEEDRYMDGAKLYKGERVEIYLPTNWLAVPFMPYVLECDEVKFLSRESFANDEDHGIDTSITSDGSFLLLLPKTGMELALDSMPSDITENSDKTKEILDGIKLEGFDENIIDSDEEVRKVFEELLEREDVHNIEYVCDMFNQMYMTSVYRVS